ncbi:MAG TPA: glycine cleavage system aminomethyltransferase GcvT [Candidatus Kapabacteria bacterium]
MKHTPFYEKHVALGGKMVEFAGYEMPVQYPKGIIAEHKAVRESSATKAGGVFDVSHMGEFDVAGPDAFHFLQTITTNDVAALTPGKAQYSSLPNEHATLLDDLIVYMLEPDHYMVVVNGATLEKDWAWFTKQAQKFDVKLRNDSDATALLAIQGKGVKEMLQTLTDVDLDAIEYYHFAKGRLAGVDMLIARTGYTGEPGFELFFPSDAKTANQVWDAVFQAGTPKGLEPIGLGARDTLRLEMGYCLYGNDIDETTNPLEAGLAWITKLNKSPECLAFPALRAIKEKGLTRKLVGFSTDEKGAIMRHGHSIVDANGTKIGEVTSGNLSPMLNKSIALGYVPTELSKDGSVLLVEVRPGKRVKAIVQKPPFIKPEVK